MCADFGKSDHFLIETRVCFNLLSAGAEARENCKFSCQFPPHWHMHARWQEALIHIEPAICALADLVSLLGGPIDAALGSRRRHTAINARRWFLDCVCWLQWLLAWVARDGWVHPSSNTAGELVPARNPAAYAAPSGSTAEVRNLLRSFLASADLPVNIVQKCFKLVRKPKMQTAGQQLSRAATHRAWCEKLRTQCAGPTLPSTEVEQRMCHAASSMLCRAWAARSLCAPNIFEPKVCTVIAGWKTSTAVPPDLIPRAAFVCNTVA